MITLKEAAVVLARPDIDENILAQLRGDHRVGIQRLLKRRAVESAERERVARLYSYERRYVAGGCKLVAGVDEAGRGPLAGPVVVAAVILPLELYIPKINDSKKLSASTREKLYKTIMEQAVAVRSAIIDQRTIDELNIYRATVLGMHTVIEALRPQPEHVLIDAVEISAAMPTHSLIRGDALSASIAAASIVAKVERDRLMVEYDSQYPQYGFARHKGYGTKEHLAAVAKYGPCPLHRRSFEPIKSWRDEL